MNTDSLSWRIGQWDLYVDPYHSLSSDWIFASYDGISPKGFKRIFYGNILLNVCSASAGQLIIVMHVACSLDLQRQKLEKLDTTC